jgi:hypothetical protein
LCVGGDGNPVRNYKNPVVHPHMIHTVWASDRQQFLTLRMWSRENFGKSHGSGSKWIVVNGSAWTSFGKHYQRGVAFLNQRAAMLARLTWG